MACIDHKGRFFNDRVSYIFRSSKTSPEDFFSFGTQMIHHKLMTIGLMIYFSSSHIHQVWKHLCVRWLRIECQTSEPWPCPTPLFLAKENLITIILILEDQSHWLLKVFSITWAPFSLPTIQATTIGNQSDRKRANGTTEDMVGNLFQVHL